MDSLSPLPLLGRRRRFSHLRPDGGPRSINRSSQLRTSLLPEVLAPSTTPLNPNASGAQQVVGIAGPGVAVAMAKVKAKERANR